MCNNKVLDSTSTPMLSGIIFLTIYNEYNDFFNFMDPLSTNGCNLSRATGLTKIIETLSDKI